MSQAPRTLVCPSCGAPLKAAPEDRRVQCQYCHATVELPGEDQPPILIQLEPPAVDTLRGGRRDTRSALVIIIGLLILTGVLVALPFLLFSHGGAARGAKGATVYTLVNSLLLPDSNTVIGIGYNSDETHRLTYLDFDQSRPLRWQGEDLGKDTYSAALVNTPDQIVAAVQTRIFALSKADGSKLWETSLSDQLPVGCESCLQSGGGLVFALTQIGTLHAYDLTSGKQVWSANLTQTPRDLYLFNAGPAVVDEVDGKAAVVVFDLQTGRRLQQISPECPNRTFSDPQTMDLYTPLRPAPDGTTFFVAYGTWEPGCLDQWNAASGTRLSQTLFPMDVVDNELYWVQTEGGLYFAPARTNQLWAVNPAAGEAHILPTDADYSIRPLTFQGDVLVVEAKRTRGSTRYALWGLDRTSGERLWQFIPQAEESVLDSANSIIDSGGVFAAHAAPEGLYILQAMDDPARITLERLDLQTGVSQGQSSYTPPESTIFTPTLLGWQADKVWLDCEGIQVLELPTAKRVFSWP